MFRTHGRRFAPYVRRFAPYVGRFAPYWDVSPPIETFRLLGKTFRPLGKTFRPLSKLRHFEPLCETFRPHSYRTFRPHSYRTFLTLGKSFRFPDISHHCHFASYSFRPRRWTFRIIVISDHSHFAVVILLIGLHWCITILFQTLSFYRPSYRITDIYLAEIIFAIGRWTWWNIIIIYRIRYCIKTNT